MTPTLTTNAAPPAAAPRPWICRDCGHTDTKCPTCSKCLRCHTCVCVKCGGCEKKFRQQQKKGDPRPICGVCLYCRKCCECRKCPRYLSDKALGVIATTTPGGPALLTRLPRTIGIELEIGDWKQLINAHHTSIPGLKYTATHDWSVKPSEREMVCSPIRGDALVRGMLELSRAGMNNRIELNESCALHVHVGGKDLSYWDIRRLLTVYRTVEPEIYSNLIVPHRRALPSIHYCQMMTSPHVAKGCERCHRYDTQYPGQRRIPDPIDTVLSRMWMSRTTEDLKITLLRMLYGIENPSNFPDTISARKGGHFEYARYFGLNLHSWMHRMTVEFRMKEATIDPWEIVFWPLWCGWFVHAITRMSDADAKGVTGLRQFTTAAMPAYFLPWLDKHGVK